MTAQPKPYISEDDYLLFEETSATKHEYYDGEIYAMTGGSEPHNLIAGNAYAALHAQLRQKPCRVYNSDQRIKITATGLNTYPDVTVVCGPVQFTDTKRLTITNPSVVIEVLSPSTERYDRGMKFRHYRTVDTLTDYILIAQDSYRIEQYVRQPNGEWLLKEAVGLEGQIVLQSIQCVLTLADAYEKVDLEQEETGIPRQDI